MAADFKLGSALVKAPGSHDHVPDAWRASLLRDHLDSPSRLALALTCRSGLDVLLQEWDQATLTLPIRSSLVEDHQQLLGRVCSVRQQLNVRQDLETLVALQQHGGISEEDTWWHFAFGGLSTGPTLNLAFSLQFDFITRSILSFLGAAFPALRSLTVGTLREYGDGGCKIRFPSPRHLTAVQHLTVDRWVQRTEVALLQGIAPYLPRLTSLSLGQGFVPVVPDRITCHIFKPVFTHTTTSLKKLSLPCELQPLLCKLLQQQTQALEELTVRTVRPIMPVLLPTATEEEYQPVTLHPTCSWTRIRLTGFVLLNELVWLPQPACGDKLIIELASSSIVNASLSDLDKVADALSRYDVRPGSQSVVVDNPQTLGPEGPQPEVPELLQLPDPYPFYHNASVAGNPALEPAQQPQALRRALTLLQPLKAPRTQLSLGGLTMSEALACELAGEAAAGWQHLCLGRIEWPADVVLTTRLPLVTLLHLSKTTVLTDELQLSMLRSVSYASSLRVRRLSDIQLQRQFPKGIQRRWGAIEIEGTVELASWLAQAERSGVRFWNFNACIIKPSLEQVHSGEYKIMAERIKDYVITGVKHLRIQTPPAKRHGLNNMADQARILEAGLTLARAVTFHVDVLTMNGHAIEDGLLPLKLDLPPAQLTELSHGYKIDLRLTYRLKHKLIDAARTADMLDILFHKDQLSDDEAEASDKWSLQGDTPSHSPMHSPERVPQESLARSNMPQPSAVMATQDATLGGDDWQSEPEANDNWSLQGDSPMHSPERVPQESLANNSMDRRSAATRAQAATLGENLFDPEGERSDDDLQSDQQTSDDWSLQGDTPTGSPTHSPQRVPHESLARNNMARRTARMATQDATLGEGRLYSDSEQFEDDWQSQQASDDWSLQGDTPIQSPERVPHETLACKNMTRRSAAACAQGAAHGGDLLDAASELSFADLLAQQEGTGDWDMQEDTEQPQVHGGVRSPQHIPYETLAFRASALCAAQGRCSTEGIIKPFGTIERLVHPDDPGLYPVHIGWKVQGEPETTPCRPLLPDGAEAYLSVHAFGTRPREPNNPFIRCETGGQNVFTSSIREGMTFVAPPSDYPHAHLPVLAWTGYPGWRLPAAVLIHFGDAVTHELLKDPNTRTTIFVQFLSADDPTDPVRLHALRDFFLEGVEWGKKEGKQRCQLQQTHERLHRSQAQRDDEELGPYA